MQYLVANSWGARTLLWKWDLLEAGCCADGKYFGVGSQRDLLCHVLPTFSFALLRSWSPPEPCCIAVTCEGVTWRSPLCWGCGCSLAVTLFCLYNPRYALYLPVCVYGSLLTLWEIRTELPEEPFCCCSQARPLFPLCTQVQLSLWVLWGRIPGENTWPALKG